MRPWTTLGLAATLFLGGCLSKAVTKNEAAQIISTSTAFTRPKFAHVPRQMTMQGYAFRSGGILSITDIARFDPTLAILKLQRAVTVSEHVYPAEVGELHQLVVSPVGIDSALLLADQDRTRSSDQQEQLDAQEERRDNFSRVGYYSSFKKELGWRVPIGTRQFLQVERIHNWRDANEQIPVNELMVEFTWRWVPNEFGDAFDTQSATFRSFPDEVQEAAATWGIRMNTEGTMLSRAYLRREGKQWQLSVIHWSTGRGNPR